MTTAVHKGGMLRSKLNISKQGGYILWKGEGTYTHSKENLIHRYISVYIYIHTYIFIQASCKPPIITEIFTHMCAVVYYIIEGSTHLRRRQSNSGCSQACFCTSCSPEAASGCACSYSSAGRTLECRLQRAASWSGLWPELWPWAWE